MDPALEEFEAARANRALRTDYPGHQLAKPDKKGAIRPAPESTHRDRTRHEGTAADLARAYVAAHPELEAIYGGLSIPDLVTGVDLARAVGNEERRIQIDAWLMAKFAPQHITGVHTGTEADR